MHNTLLICSEHMSTIQSANDRELAKIQKQDFPSWFSKKVLVFYNLIIQSIFTFTFHNDTYIISNYNKFIICKSLTLLKPVLIYTH